MLTPDAHALERLTAERDAAIAVAIHAGKSTFGLTDAEAYQAIGRSLRAWLDPDMRATTRDISASVRKAAGLERDPC